MKKKFDIASIIFIVLVSIFLVYFFVPVFSGIFLSFTNWNGLSAEYEFVGIDNYLKMFHDVRFDNAICNTLLYAIILLTFSLVLGYLFARVIKEKKRGKSGVLFLTFFPYVMTPVVVCVLWNQIFINLIPQIGKLLNIDILKVNLLASKTTALFAVSFVDLWMLIPYTMLLILSAFNAIPTDLIEYAKLEHASGWKMFKYVEFPYLLPSFGMIITIIFSYALTHISTIMTLTAGGPGRSTETMYYVIYKNSTNQYSYGLAEGMFVAIISILAFIIINRFTNSNRNTGITYGGDSNGTT